MIIFTLYIKHVLCVRTWFKITDIVDVFEHAAIIERVEATFLATWSFPNYEKCFSQTFGCLRRFDVPVCWPAHSSFSGNQTMKPWLTTHLSSCIKHRGQARSTQWPT